MPYSANVYTLPPGTAATTLTPIDSSDYNSFIDDIEQAQNAKRPVVAGGTGGDSVITGWDGLAKKGTDIATASSINLTTATGPSLTLTGTTTITAVTLAEGSFRLVRAAGAFQITASASLLCNGSSSVNMSVVAEDLLVFRGGSGGVVNVARIGAASLTFATPAQALAGTSTTLVVNPAGLYLPTGHLFGLTLSNNATDATNDIDIAAGTARDASDTYNYVLASALGKQLDVAWAVGGTPASTKGGLDTGSVGNNRYAIWGIGRSDTQVRDVLFSLSFTAPTMPTSYDYKVLLGEVTRSGAANGAPLWYGRRKASGGYDGINFAGPVNTTTGGTAISFTSAIHSWATRFKLSIHGVSWSGTSIPLVQLGVGGTYQTSGYLGATLRQNAGTGTSIQWGAGVSVETVGSAAIIYASSVVGELVDAATGQWDLSIEGSATTNNAAYAGHGYKVLSGALDSIRLIATNGTDTIDANAGVQLNWE